MGTSISLTLYIDKQENAFDTIFERIKDIETKMSSQQEGSEVTAINKAAGLNPVTVSPDTFYVVENALSMAELSRGAFDPAIGPIVKLWDITGEKPHVATAEELTPLLPLVDYHDIVVNKAETSVFLKKPGMAIDLGAIAKGYAADEAARICRDLGIKHAILDLGGNVYVVGDKPDGSPWKIGIQRPDKERGTILGVVTSGDATIVTSGPYERFFERDGKRYHHIIDPTTGYPSENELAQVSIYSKESSMLSDGLSTACFVAGLEKGMEIIKKSPGFEAVFVTKDKKVYVSPGLEGIFSLRDSEFASERLPF